MLSLGQSTERRRVCRYIRCHWDRALREGVYVGTHVVIGTEH